MRLPRILLFALLLPVFLGSNGCVTDPGQGPVDFRAERLNHGRTLFAGHFQDNPEYDLGLYILYSPGTTSYRYYYRRGDRNYIAPVIGTNNRSQLCIIFGHGNLKLYNSVKLNVVPVIGLGEEQYAAAFDTSTDSLRFAYMGGSVASGYNIVVQSGADGTPTSLTSDASTSRIYWTPNWSTDGEWVLYCRATGTTGADAQLWRVHPDGTGAEQLPITTTELPTYAVFNPTATEVLVPGDFTSYKVADGTVGMFDHLREDPDFLSALQGMNFEFVGSQLTGPVHEGDATTTARHTFPISVAWPNPADNRIWFDALVATASGPAPHEVLGVVIFTWTPHTKLLVQHTDPMKIAESRCDGYRWSLVRPTIIP